jgi:hypothetical protein
VRVADTAGSFAGDKDAAAAIRDSYLLPTLADGGLVTLDFSGVDLATQSFIHALIASAIRSSADALDQISFVSCNANVQSIIEIVVEYAQDDFE